MAADHAGDQRLGPRRVDPAGAERELGGVGGARGRGQVDPGAVGQVQLVAASRSRDTGVPCSAASIANTTRPCGPGNARCGTTVDPSGNTELVQRLGILQQLGAIPA